VTTLLTILAWDKTVQAVGLVMAILGVGLSAWLSLEAWEDYHSVRHNRQLEQIIGRSHLRSQVVMLIIQAGFALVSLLVLRLPPVPLTMATDVHGPLVVLVIVTRKIVRLGQILLLMGVAVRQAQDRRRALGLVGVWSPRDAR